MHDLHLEPTSIDEWLNEFKDCQIFFVLCTRDIHISERSRLVRGFSLSQQNLHAESQRAKEIIIDLLGRELDCFLWSYETFMYLERDYLRLLNRFLGIEADFMPTLQDGNLKFLTSGI